MSSSISKFSASTVVAFPHSLFGGSSLSWAQRCDVSQKFCAIIEKKEVWEKGQNVDVFRFECPILSVPQFKDLIEWLKQHWVEDTEVRLENGMVITDNNLEWVIWQSWFIFSKSAWETFRNVFNFSHAAARIVQ